MRSFPHDTGDFACCSCPFLSGNGASAYQARKRLFVQGSKCVRKCVLLASSRTVEDGQRDLVDPAVKGTKNVLSAVAKSLDTVKRVVLTSSFAGAHKIACSTLIMPAVRCGVTVRVWQGGQ